MREAERPSARDDARAFENAYEQTPSWEVGHVQPVVTRAFDAGLLAGDVLDVGCGTGENTRWLADAGIEVVGVDFSTRGIARALAGPATTARFVVADVRSLAAAGFGPDGRTFATVLDVGCFHTLQPYDRDRYATSVREALRPNGRLVLVCWSDLNEFGRGPARVTRAEIRGTFAGGWVVEGIEPETLESRLPPGSVAAWIATIRRADAGASAAG
jgi:SAM-dependent methyltransferase